MGRLYFHYQHNSYFHGIVDNHWKIRLEDVCGL